MRRTRCVPARNGKEPRRLHVGRPFPAYSPPGLFAANVNVQEQQIHGAAKKRCFGRAPGLVAVNVNVRRLHLLQQLHRLPQHDGTRRQRRPKPVLSGRQEHRSLAERGANAERVDRRFDVHHDVVDGKGLGFVAVPLVAFLHSAFMASALSVHSTFATS